MYFYKKWRCPRSTLPQPSHPIPHRSCPRPRPLPIISVLPNTLSKTTLQSSILLPCPRPCGHIKCTYYMPPPPPQHGCHTRHLPQPSSVAGRSSSDMHILHTLPTSTPFSRLYCVREGGLPPWIRRHVMGNSAETAPITACQYTWRGQHGQGGAFRYAQLHLPDARSKHISICHTNIHCSGKFEL